MPCSDSSSSVSIKLTPDERFVSFDFAKITCGREITAQTGYSQYCAGRSLEDILKIPYSQVAQDLKINSEESQFILYLEWDALRSSIAQYLGVEDEDIDKERCLITSIEYSNQGIEFAEVILPPKELPKIMACGMVDKIKKEETPD
ncbi:MAG: hypothetical protein NUV91_03090 [Candidatus Omnitrophica bacterium]|nr:hypothetical protein [Candidatus Omnitrophota bacterium]